jgi:hypothetical protein
MMERKRTFKLTADVIEECLQESLEKAQTK